MIAPVGPLPAGVAICLPDLTELRSHLAWCFARSSGPRGQLWRRDEAEAMARHVLTWLDHSGLPLSDLCDGTLTVMLIDPPEETPLSPCDH